MRGEGTAGWDALRARRAVVPGHVVTQGFAQETVLLNLRTGQYFGVDAVGGRFLGALAAAGDLDAASRALAAEYGQPPERIEQDLGAFVRTLVDRDLLALVDAEEG